LEIWNDLIHLSNKIEKLFNDNLNQYPISEEINFKSWKDQYWKSNEIRKCHLKTIDNRDTQKLWLMHINIFPQTHINLPILGFDIVAGPNKITGSFFDYSPVDKHPYMDYFYSRVKDLSWNKPRELPDWAQQIFSKNMIAAGNIRTEEEIKQLSEVCFELIHYYIENSNNINNKVGDYKDNHNFYCQQQKLNPHLHRSIISMGISEEDKDRYVNRVLFEEIP
jgi:hypothetical protein